MQSVKAEMRESRKAKAVVKKHEWHCEITAWRAKNKHERGLAVKRQSKFDQKE